VTIDKERVSVVRGVMVWVGVVPATARVWPSNHGYSGIAPASGHNLDSGIALGVRPSRPARTGTARRRGRRRGSASSLLRSWRVGQHRCARSGCMAWLLRCGSLYPSGGARHRWLTHKPRHGWPVARPTRPPHDRGAGHLSCGHLTRWESCGGLSAKVVPGSESRLTLAVEWARSLRISYCEW
jgi:hypothetical protein